MKPARARADVSTIEADLTPALRRVRERLNPADGSPDDHDLCAIETFCAVALRVMRKVNPSKVRDEARTLEIQARMDGVPVLREAA